MENDRVGIFLNKVFIILIKSVFSSIAIGYLLYSFIYINNNDFCSPSNILDSSCYLDNPHAEGKNIIKDQPVILASYISWLKNASKLDFGEFSRNNSREVFPFAINRFITSIKLILLSVLISFIFSLVIHFSSQNQLLRDYLAEPFIYQKNLFSHHQIILTKHYQPKQLIRLKK